jgi:hypothetical protein
LSNHLKIAEALVRGWMRGWRRHEADHPPARRGRYGQMLTIGRKPNFLSYSPVQSKPSKRVIALGLAPASRRCVKRRSNSTKNPARFDIAVAYTRTAILGQAVSNSSTILYESVLFWPVLSNDAFSDTNRRDKRLASQMTNEPLRSFQRNGFNSRFARRSFT